MIELFMALIHGGVAVPPDSALSEKSAPRPEVGKKQTSNSGPEKA